MNYEVEEDDEVNSVLWVGNLDSKVTEAMMYELFLQAGPVKNIHFPKGVDGTGHKGYCFVQFYHNASVPYTMELMQGATMFGKKLKLQPRPGSIHRKIMDQKLAENRQELLIQQQQSHLLPQHPQPWFGIGPPPPAPQLAQIQNMVIYQNQMFQPYTAAQNANQFPVAFQSQMGPQIMQIQIQQQQQAQQQAHQQLQQQQQPQQHPQLPQSPPQQQSPRHFQQQQQALSYSFISSPTHRIPNAIHSSVAPSHVTPLNGTPNYPRHQGQLQHRAGTGVLRPQRHTPPGQMALSNGHLVNGNRISFQPLPRHGTPAGAGAPPIMPQPASTPQLTQQPIQLVSPIYPPPTLLSPEQSFVAQAPPNAGPVPPDMQQAFFRRPAPPQAVVTSPAAAAAAAAALGLGNGYQNIQIYHY